MDRSRKSIQPPIVFILGSLFILAVTATQVWRSQSVVCIEGNNTWITDKDYSAWQAQTESPPDLTEFESLTGPSANRNLPALVPSPARWLPSGSAQWVAAPVPVAPDVPTEELSVVAVATTDPFRRDPSQYDRLVSATAPWSDPFAGLDYLPRQFTTRRPVVSEPKTAPIAPTEASATIVSDATETQAPRTQAPKTQAPKTQAPKTQAPKTQAPKTQAPKTQAPKTQAPRTQAPKTQAPRTQAPEPAATPTPRQDLAPIVDLPQRRSWPRPVKLLEEMRPLESIPVLSQWCEQVHRELEMLQSLRFMSDDRGAEPLNRLRILSQVAHFPNRQNSLVQQLANHQQRTALMTASHSIARRVAVWQQVHRVSTSRAAEERMRHIQPDPALMSRLVGNLCQLLGDNDNGKAWRDFLLLDDLQEFVESEEADDATARLLAAQEILGAWEFEALSATQQAFLKHPTLLAMRKELNRWITSPVSMTELVKVIERFEQKPTLQYASPLATMRVVLQNSPVPVENDLADAIATYYRNANIRLTTTEMLINRLIPVIRSSNRPIRDWLFGMEIRGNGWTHARTQVDFLPNEDSVQLALETNGQIGVSTTSSGNGARIYSNNRSDFTVRKNITVDRQGMRVAGARASANAESRLTRIRTNYDGIPLIGPMFRKLVRKEFNERSGQARVIFQNKVVTEAKRTMDQQVNMRLAKMESKLSDGVVGRLQALELDSVATDMRTTDQEVAVRLRLAGEHQLAAFTPRPIPQRQNLMSLQLHESAINNVLQQLELEGMKRDLRGVCRHICEKLQLETIEWVNEVPEDAHVEFSNREAIHIACDDGRVTITMKIQELDLGQRKWKCFIVTAHYRPQVNGLYIQLGREDCIELKGKRLRLKDQVALRGIFSKVFSKNRPLNVIPEDFAGNQRLADLAVKQLSLENGWVGVSIDSNSNPPAQTARRTGQRTRSR